MSKYFFRNVILFHVKQNDLWIKSVFKKVGYLVSRGTYFLLIINILIAKDYFLILNKRTEVLIYIN